MAGSVNTIDALVNVGRFAIVLHAINRVRKGLSVDILALDCAEKSVLRCVVCVTSPN